VLFVSDDDKEIGILNSEDRLRPDPCGSLTLSVTSMMYFIDIKLIENVGPMFSWGGIRA
jgi:hypothetical protein